jgi:acyl-CoA hydrolase
MQPDTPVALRRSAQLLDAKRCAPEAVLDAIPERADLIVPLANGEPTALLEVLEEGADRLCDVRIHQMHALHDRPYLHDAFPGRLRHVSYFLSPVTRGPYRKGHLDLVPSHFSEVPMHLEHSTRCSLVLAAASPPDRHGYFSLGTNADYAATFIGKVPFFLEVTPAMPRTFGRNQLHVSQIAGYAESERPLLEVSTPTAGKAERRIAEFVVQRIRNGATVQIGIGAIPNAVLALLEDHHDLGVHTELVSDGIVDLFERGVITGTAKTLNPGKMVSTFALGTRRLYDFLEDNPSVEFWPVDYVNNPRIIAREDNFVSVNATLEVDLLGQCASESIGSKQYSGSGGQSDFARGCMYSRGGMAFIVLRSTTSDGSISRIRPQLTPGAVVTTNKNTVDHVVTEHGVAELRGRSIAERARALIEIAHPDFRDELRHEAGSLGFL